MDADRNMNMIIEFSNIFSKLKNKKNYSDEAPKSKLNFVVLCLKNMF